MSLLEWIVCIAAILVSMGYGIWRLRKEFGPEHGYRIARAVLFIALSVAFIMRLIQGITGTLNIHIEVIP